MRIQVCDIKKTEIWVESQFLKRLSQFLNKSAHQSQFLNSLSHIIPPQVEPNAGKQLVSMSAASQQLVSS
jgi:hypothetical protein